MRDLECLWEVLEVMPIHLFVHLEREGDVGETSGDRNTLASILTSCEALDKSLKLSESVFYSIKRKWWCLE